MLLVQLVVIDYTCPWALRGFNLLPKFKNWKVKPPILKRRINFFGTIGSSGTSYLLTYSMEQSPS